MRRRKDDLVTYAVSSFLSVLLIIVIPFPSFFFFCFVWVNAYYSGFVKLISLIMYFSFRISKNALKKKKVVTIV